VTAPGEFGEDSMNEQIRKLFHAYGQTVMFINPEVKGVSASNIPIEELPCRRRLQTFEIINAEFLVT
jgi:hypothetical protein